MPYSFHPNRQNDDKKPNTSSFRFWSFPWSSRRIIGQEEYQIVS